MKSSERLPFTQWVDIHRTEKFISVEPLSGYRQALRENEGYVIYLPRDASDDALGAALLETLERSRFILPREDPEFFKWDRYERCEQNWQKDFMRRSGYKTRREAYQTMDWVRVERSEGKISFQPHNRDKPGRWIWLAADRTVVISATTEAAAAGAALRDPLALGLAARLPKELAQ
jgi:hypothetical protein